jgi:hypothetical protein
LWVLAIVVLSIGTVVAMRSSDTFKKVVNKFYRKHKVNEVAEIGANLAIQEFRRRFSQMANPSNSEPYVNAQYRPMYSNSPAAVAGVLTQYAQDFFNISVEDGCPAGSLVVSGTPGAGTFYGNAATDRPVCINVDPSLLGYKYTVKILNRAELNACAANGYFSPLCESTDPANRTRLITQACINYYSANGNWSDPSCNPPASFHYGDVPGNTSSTVPSVPVLGYQLIIESSADDENAGAQKTGAKATVRKELFLMVNQSTNFNTASKGIDIDGMNFMLGGNINGTVQQIIPPNYLSTLWTGFQAPLNNLAHWYSLGERYQFGASFVESNFGGSDQWLDHTTSAGTSRFGGMTVGGLFSNIGINGNLQTMSRTPPCAYCNPAQADDYSAAFGAMSASMGVAVDEGGAFDETDLRLNKLASYDAGPLGGVASSVVPAGGTILVSTGVTDGFAPAAIVDNNANFTANRSVVMTGAISLTGNVYIPGDLYLINPIVDTNGGKGTLMAKGNIYIAGNVTKNTTLGGAVLQNLGNTTVAGYNYGQACITGGVACDNLELVAAGNVVIGNITNAYTAAFLATTVSASASQLSLDAPPMDGLRTTDYSQTFQSMAPRNSAGGWGGSWDNIMQVGYEPASFTAGYDVRNPAETVAPGLLPEGAGHIYGTGDKHYNWQFFGYSDGATQTWNTQLTGWGYVRPQSDGYPDKLGRLQPPCMGSSDYCDGASSAVNGGFLQNGWGSDTVHTKTPWISPQTFNDMYFDGVANAFPAVAAAAVADCRATGYTFDCVSLDANNDGDFADAGDVPNTVSTTNLIDARVVSISGFVTGIGGNGPGNGSAVPPATPNPLQFFGGGATPNPRLIELARGVLPADKYLIDRDDATTCPGAGTSVWDCDNNGLTITNGVYGNILLFTQGGLFIYKSNQAEPVPAGARMSFVATAKFQ